MLVGCYLAVLSAVALLWARFNFSGVYRKNLQHRLDPQDEPQEAGEPASGRAALDGFAPVSAAGDQANERLPMVALLCPGRNEAEHLDQTLPGLCQQDYPRYRVVFVDDHSDDATPAITAACAARYGHLTVLRHAGDPPAGWTGKCWALHLGYQRLQQLEQAEQAAALADDQAEGATADERSLPQAEFLCFTDADIHWDPRCLRRAVELAQHSGADVVALWPRLTFGSAAEAIVQMQMVLAIGLLFPFEKAMDPAWPDTLTGGAFILVRRSLYDRIGGHEAVHDQVVEDLALGRKLKAAGGRIRIALAPQLLWCRMYNGWADMWEGLTKNAYAGMEYRPLRLAWVVPVILLANVLPPVYLIASLLWLAAAPSPWALAGVGLSAMTVLLPARAMNVVRRLLDLPARYAWTVPLGSALYAAIILASAWRYHHGGNVWKDRAYGPTTRPA